ncbi:protein S100-P-like [Leuresthes tenuis]|uniref:protein S100-P-like n=1 Tax=Leuresthes tenuis TaxID=355514 RepID=UPI003B4FFC9C
MNPLETAMCLLLHTFDKYASSDGKTGTLSKKEMKTMIEKELPILLQGAKNQEEADKLLSDLDLNGDSEVDFTEFVTIVAALTCTAKSP